MSALADDLTATIRELAREATNDEELAELLVPYVLVACARATSERRTLAMFARELAGGIRLSAAGDASPTAGATVPTAPDSSTRLASSRDASPRLGPPCWKFLVCGRTATVEVYDGQGGYRKCCDVHAADATPLERRAIR